MGELCHVFLYSIIFDTLQHLCNKILLCKKSLFFRWAYHAFLLHCDPTQLYMEFPETLRRAIESVGANQTDIAKQIGVTQPLLGRYLSGKMVPKDETLKRLVAWFDEQNQGGASDWGTRLANAWTRSRLGTDLADRVLVSKGDISVRESHDFMADTSEDFARAIKVLVAQGRRHKEIRRVVEQFAEVFSSTPFPKD